MPLSKLHTVFSFYQFPTNVLFSIPGSNPGYHIACSQRAFSVFSRLWLFLSLFQFFVTLRLLKSIWQVFCRMYFNWVCLLFSHGEAGVMGFLEEHHRGEYLGALLIASYPEYMISTWILTGRVGLDLLVEVVSAMFLHSKDAYFYLSTLLLEVSH